MKIALKIFWKNIIIYVIALFIDSVFTAMQYFIINHLEDKIYTLYDFYDSFMRFFFWGLILFIWFAFPAIILFNIFVFSKREWFKRVLHFILLGALLGCLSFAIGGGLSFENGIELVIGTIHYTIMGGIYAWIFHLIIIKPQKKIKLKQKE